MAFTLQRSALGAPSNARGVAGPRSMRKGEAVCIAARLIAKALKTSRSALKRPPLAPTVARAAPQVVASGKKQLMMWEALREAVDEEMERDPTVCVMGACPQRVHCSAQLLSIAAPLTTP